MTFSGFNSSDFDVFQVPGLEPRMEMLIERVRPKLEELGTELTPYLTDLCGEEMFMHVAKHARRTVNPPKDTWVAWASSKRGYKALPHFEVGMFDTHVFVIFAIIYESPNKAAFAEGLERQLDEVRSNLPGQYYWSMDHMAAHGTLQKDMQDEDYDKIITKLKTVKKAEVMCGLRIDRDDPLAADGDKFLETVRSTFKTLLPLYKMSLS
ncbi:YktB family protein [Paenibacillus sp. NPDC057886]|uniref:YktB family protein n=1 Tax=Paenibacillus sp. NPDC057886 TaxID=3346270 RepID=UPI003691AAD2